MPKFAANLSMMFVEHAFLDRFDAAADAGFAAVEFLFPYDHAPEAIAARLERNHLTQALFNLPPGRWEEGERGLAALPDRFEEFKSGLTRALDYVAATGVKRVHMMAGNASRSDAEAEASYRRAICVRCPDPGRARRRPASGADQHAKHACLFSQRFRIHSRSH